MRLNSKWHEFQSSYSPIKAADLNTGQHNLKPDWTRLALSNEVTINGVSLSEVAKPYMQETSNGLTFSSDNEVKNFFSEVILRDMSDVTNKNQAADYLLTVFHQGGLMYPVSTPLTDLGKDETGKAVMTLSPWPENYN